MADKINTKGVTFAKSLITAGKINSTSPWSFTAADGNKLLGPDGDDWTNFGKYHLIENTDASENTKARFKFPFGKNDMIYRSGLVAIRQRAGQQKMMKLFETAGTLLESLDKKIGKDQKHKKDSYWEHEAIVANLDDFIPGSFSYRSLEPGIWVQEGQLVSDPQGTSVIYSYQFSNMQFTAEQSQEWLTTNKVTAIKFIPAKKQDNTVNRFDVMDKVIDFHVEPFKRNTDGFLEGRAIVTNVGVFTYRDAEGNVLRELRPPEEVFDGFSLETLKMVPITNSHPDERVDIENIKDLQAGSTGDRVWRDEYAISVPIKITDQQTIQEITTGNKMALSCGYSADLEMSSGNWLGVPYDAIQRNIRYNHVAIVPDGRAGDLAKIVLRRDSKDAIMVSDKTNNDNKGGTRMKKIIIDGIEYEASPEVINAFNKATAKVDELDEKIEKMTADNTEALSTVEAERDTFKDEVEKLKKTIEDNKLDEVKIKALVDERLSIVENAKKAEIEVKDEMTNLDLKKAIIMKHFPNAVLDEKDEVYINARYDSAIEIQKTKEPETPPAPGIEKVKTDHQRDDAGNAPLTGKERYDKYIEDLENEHKDYKGPITA